MKILIKGYYGFGNLGDDVLMITSYKLLKEMYPDAEYYIFANFNNNLKNFKRRPNYNYYIFELLGAKVKLIDWTYKGCFDFVFDGGGGVYFDYRESNRFFALINALCFFLGAKRVFIVDKILRKVFRKDKHLKFNKRIGVGLGLGPFTKSSPSLFRKISEIGSYDSLVVRDKRSFEILNQLSFRGTKGLSTDMAFLKDYWCPKVLPVTKYGKEKKNRVGLVLMDMHSFKEVYFNNIKKLVDELYHQGFLVTLLSFDINHDRHYIKSFENDVICWQPDKQKLQDFLTIIANQDLIITARAHGAIIAACLGVPSICLQVSPKLKDVSEMLPTSSQLITVPFEPCELLNSTNKVFQNYPSYIHNVKKDVDMNEIKIQGVVRNLFS